jgi:hypothetical protein
MLIYMRWKVLWLTVFICASASGQVYQRIAPDGSVSFSDRPGADAERIDVAPAQAVRLPTVTQPGAGLEEQGEPLSGKPGNETFAYTEFAIVSPGNKEAIRANDGNVTVRVALRPALQPGHAIVVYIDGDEVSSFDHTTMQLTSLHRGPHTLEAKVVDDQGEELAQAKPVTFHVLRVTARR